MDHPLIENQKTINELAEKINQFGREAAVVAKRLAEEGNDEASLSDEIKSLTNRFDFVTDLLVKSCERRAVLKNAFNNHPHIAAS